MFMSAFKALVVCCLIVISGLVDSASAASRRAGPRSTERAIAETITVTKGMQRMIDFYDPVRRIVVGDGAIVDASALTDRQVRLVGMKNGRTNITIYGDDDTVMGSYSVIVAPDVALLRSLLARDPSTKGLKLLTEGDHVMLTGTASDLQAYNRVVAALKSYLGDGGFVDMAQVSAGQMVAVDIHFAAVQADTLKEIGFNFRKFGQNFSIATSGPGTLSGYSFGGDGSSTALSLASSLPLAQAFNVLVASPSKNMIGVLSVLSSADLAQILAEPTLMVRSGEKASFIAGGEVPIPIPQGLTGTITIRYHQFGVSLEVAPTVVSPGRISLTVSPEVSEIDPSHELVMQGFRVPAFRKRATSTTIELNDGQSFVLAGLMYSNNTNGEQKVPGLAELPVLGSFFKYSSNQRQKQELIIIATPHIVQPLDVSRMPPLPGQEMGAAYNPGVGNMLLNTQPLDRAMGQYGLLP
jgi:pilus assembly protein CpaC